MGDGSTGKKVASTTEMDNLTLSVSTSSFSRDLLQRFLGSSSRYEEAKEGKEGEDDEIELNLGLSLGGRFGVDKSSNKLIRSSSIASCLPVVRDDNDAVAPSPVTYAGLMRTSSLPVETEEEWRKRKELQTMRRMEAKRRRSEKLRNLKGDKERGGSGSVGRSGSLTFEERKEIEVHLREKLDREKYLEAVRKLRSAVGSQSELLMLGGGSDVALTKGKGSYVGSSGGMQEGSVESKGVSSSSLSDLESKSLQGSKGELSPTSIQSMRDSTTRARESTSSTAGPETESSSRRPDTSRARGREIGTNSLGDMPCVFTQGDGPNGRRVDGILYKYGKGEEVRIMCVCHGSFHSPAEFVKHAGGTDVDHPLKHIVIKPSS